MTSAPTNEHHLENSIKIAELFLKEIGQKKMADDAIASHNLLRRLIESKQGLMNKSLKKLKDYSGIQQLYPKSAIANHRLVFWFNSLKKIADAMSNTEGVPWSAALDHIKNIKEEHEAIVQSEDNSTGGSRQRLIKAKNGYLCSAIDEPREGLQSKLRDLKKRRADEAKSFKDPEMRQKALELSFEDIKTFMDQNQDSSRLVFLIIIKLFFKNYSNSLNMEEFVKAGFHIAATISSKTTHIGRILTGSLRTFPPTYLGMIQFCLMLYQLCVVLGVSQNRTNVRYLSNISKKPI